LNRKLILLNVVLAGLAVYAGLQLHDMWMASKARQSAQVKKPIKVSPAPPISPLQPPPPVLASGYADIAQKMLLNPSRNPNVPLDPPPAPPPPKPMPALPVYHGMMNIGDGPTAILSMAANTPNLPIHPGEKIGEFKLLSVSRDGIDLEWDGKKVHRSLDEITVKSAAPEPAAQPQVAVAAPALPAAPVILQPTGPGTDTGRGERVCNPNDSMEAGTVVDGYRKVVRPGPFGKICYWEPLGSGR
jgi:hypothetical protein